MHTHPQPDNLFEIPASLATARSETPMFERDDLFVRERVAELRATAAAVRARDGAPVRAVARLRFVVGHALISVGATVAGIERHDHLADAPRTRLAA
jgi:hypothetical protein